MTLPCPKCQRERRPGEEACARCGLLVARWEGFSEELPSLPPVDAAWAELERAWGDEAAHQRFLELAASCDGLDVAAARYRKAARERPDDPRAAAGLERAVARAVSLYVGRSLAERAAGPPRAWKAIGLLVALVVFLAGAGAVWFVLHRM